MIPGNANPLLLASAVGAAAAVEGPIKSVRFNNGDSPYLNRTPSSASNRRTWTWAAWVKRGVISSSASRTLFSAGSGGFDVDLIVFYGYKLQVLSAISSVNWNYVTTANFADPSAWYHITIAVDTTNSTASDRVKIYVNGTRITEFDTSSAPSQNYENNINSTDQHAVSYDTGNIGYYFDGYMADIYFIDGSALDPTSFGAFDSNGVWQAAAYSGTFGTNGFHLLDFENESTIGHDSSGNENDFTANNISTTAGVGNDVLFDVPTNGTQSDSGAGGEVSGNYPTLNPLDKSSGLTLSNGNLDLSTSSGNNNFEHARATVGITSGKWYCEYTATNGRFSAGVATQDSDILDRAMGDVAGSFGIASDGTNVYKQGFPASSHSNLGNTDLFSTNDVCGIAFDADNGTLDFYKNGSAVTGASYTGLSTTDTYFFVFGDSHNGSPEIAQGSVNFGQRAFANSAPSNYKPLCTTLLPTPTIADGSAYFDAVTYTSDGQASKKLTFGFSPDFFWSKVRNFAEHHVLHDSVRGPSKVLKSSSDAAESTEASGRGVLSFDSDGVTIGIGSPYNSSGNNSVVWAWDAGSSTASNTDGSITTSVRANQTAGFSIVSFTAGSSGSYGHGLNAEPFAVIFKNRDTAGKWRFYHKDVGTSNTLFLNTTEAATSSSERVTAVSSSTFTAGGTISGDDHIAYCFAPVAGYSAFGSWEGNLSTNGPFIYTGFKVAFLLMKSADTGYDWFVYDTTRQTFNVYGPNIRANRNYAEQDDDRFDLLSNGFKVRTKSVANNASSTTYIYAAFAENPFQANGGLAR